jgi:hypothetical protein
MALLMVGFGGCTVTCVRQVNHQETKEVFIIRGLLQYQLKVSLFGIQMKDFKPRQTHYRARKNPESYSLQ